jgi:hypothetical protein
VPLLHPLGSYPVTSQRWPEEEFDRLPPTPPLSILALTLRSPSLRLRDLARADHTVGLSLLGFDAGQTYAHLDQVSVEQLLAALRLPERARVMLFNVFAHSFSNDAVSMSAAELVAMFHFYFLANPEGLGMDAPHADYQSAIWTPLRRYLRQRGVQLQTGTPVTAIDRDPAGSWQVRTGRGGTLTADEVVLATDAGTAARILGASPGATSGDQRLAAVAAQPRTGAAVRGGPVLAGRRRPQVTSIADPGVLDSVTLYHRFEAGARSWHERTGGSVVELHAYACPSAWGPPSGAGPSGGGRADHSAVEDLRVALAAGYDTTSHTLAWAVWHLARHPQWRDPQALPLFLDEILRRYPAGWLGSRIAAQDSVAAGVPVPAGTLVFYSPYLTHTDPNLWEDPHLIRPERFTVGHPAWSYLPFAAGPRTCLGAQLARLILRTALAPLARVDLAQVSGDPAMTVGLTLRPRGPLHLRAR